MQTRGQLLAVLQRNPGLLVTRRLSAVEVAAAAISPDGRLLASGDRDGVVRFTDLRTWKPSGPPLRLGRPVLEQAMQFAPDGRTRRGRLRERRAHGPALRRRRRPAGPPRPVLAAGRSTPFDFMSLLLAYAPDGRHLAVALARVPRRRRRRPRHQPAPGAARRPQRADASGSARTPKSGVGGPRRLHAGRRADHLRLAGGDDRLGRAAGADPAALSDRRAARRSPRTASASPSPSTARSPGTRTPPSRCSNLRTGKSRTLADNLPNTMSDGLAFTRDGTRIIGGTYEGTHVWDVKTGSIRRDVQRAPPEDPPRRRARPPGAGPARDERRRRQPVGPGRRTAARAPLRLWRARRTGARRTRAR